MSFKGKEVSVIITGDAKEEFEKLNKLVGEEIAKGITKSDHQILFGSIKQKIEFLKENPQYGTHVQKNRIPSDYIVQYEVNNLWKVDLSGAWRMIYTINGSEIEIIALILDILNHKDYEKKFGYRKS
jgi:mRNA-degrading endonuclease RelE of RelBE toxin-antitoxin system